MNFTDFQIHDIIMGIGIHIDVCDDKAIGMDGLILGEPLPDVYLNDPSLIKKGQKFDRMWIKDCIGVNIDSSANVDFLEYYGTLSTSIYYKDIELLTRSLKHDIHELLKYSYLFIRDCDSFYFPMINICIWTNKDIDEPGYSLSIYKYGTHGSIDSNNDSSDSNSLDSDSCDSSESSNSESSNSDSAYIDNTSNNRPGEIIDNTNSYIAYINAYNGSDGEGNNEDDSNIESGDDSNIESGDDSNIESGDECDSIDDGV